MKKYLEVYDKSKTYYFPTMEEATSERISIEYPIVNSGLPCLIETDADGLMFYSAPVTVNLMADRLGVEVKDYYSIEEAVKLLEVKLNEPEPDPEPSAEERIASAMEFQNLMSL